MASLEKDVEAAISEFFAKLSDSQEELGPGFREVLSENLWQLYQEDRDTGKDG